MSGPLAAGGLHHATAPERAAGVPPRFAGALPRGTSDPGDAPDTAEAPDAADAPDTADVPDGSRRVDRLLGRLLAIAGLVVTVAAGSRVLRTPDQFAPWWTALAVTSAALLLVLAVAGGSLPWPVLRGLWRAAVTVPLLAQLTVFAAYTGAHPDALRPWVWALEPVILCFVALLAPLPVVAGYVVLSTLAPLLSGLLFLGRVPHEVLLQTPIHLGNAACVAILYGIRARLIQRERIAAQSRRSAERRARARAIAQRQQALARIVHDEVLSTLIAATRLPGAPVPELRTAAATALRTLVQAAGTTALAPSTPPCASAARVSAADANVSARRRNSHPAGLVIGQGAADPHRLLPAEEVVRCLVRAAACWIPPSAVRIRVVPDGVAPDGMDPDGVAPDATTQHRATGGVPRPIVEEASLAMAEALRNSVAHAAGATTHRVEGEVGADGLVLVISDDGCGFDIAAVPRERMGVRGSILARMQALPGGSARIRSDPSGTRVLLEWRR